MPSIKPILILREHLYSEETQHQFAVLSGDHNPLHVDPLAARRTLVGGRAVHGIHQVLTAVEAVLTHLDFAASGGPEPGVTGLTAHFSSSILVGEVVSVQLANLTRQAAQVALQVGEEAACKVTIQFGPAPAAPGTPLPPLDPEPLAELSFAEIAGQSGGLRLGLDQDLAHKLFPRTLAALGPRALAAVLATTRLVGMRCPGLHSLFAKISLQREEVESADRLEYRVEEVDERFKHVSLAVAGGGIRGSLLAFFRPPPEWQPSMAEVGRVVKPGTFAQTVALVAGGSRGLGEITAKIVAAGGGAALVTYYQGQGDAERIVEEIRAHGGKAEAIRFDVRRDADLFQRLLGEKGITSLYYFATPKIFGRRRGFFSRELLGEFQEIYVLAFGRLLDAARNAGVRLRVFYPSSVAVEKRLRDLAEYAIAKRAGEELCAYYARYGNQSILVERLPRLRTDQTGSLLPVPAANALEAMLPLVRRTEEVESGLPPEAASE